MAFGHFYLGERVSRGEVAGLIDRRVGRVGGRPLQLLAHGFGLRGQVARYERETPRGRIGDNLAGLEARLFQLGREQARKVLAGLVLHAGGDFLRAEFEQEIGHSDHSGYLAVHSGVMCAIHASQLPLARSRTRPI